MTPPASPRPAPQSTPPPARADEVSEQHDSGGHATGPLPVAGGASGAEAGVVVAGKYRLERLLKKGGMGSVWVATHLSLGTPVAVKFTEPRVRAAGAPPSEGSAGVDAGTYARFEREARAAAQLRSTNIVQVFDYGVDGALHYLVMELLEGEDLGARLERAGRLTIDEAVGILVPVARALERAHQSDLVHRDLKPENVFLAKDGEDEVPKVLDFGVAKALRGGDERVGVTTLEGTVVGSPHYISPEQAMGRTDVDPRSDLWSLGVIAFRALTGVRPFSSEVLLEAVVEICTAPIPRATSVAPDLPPAVDAFFERALCRSLEGRFQSAREMREALSALAGAPAGRSSRAEMPSIDGTGNRSSLDPAADMVQAPRTAPVRKATLLAVALALAALAAVSVFWLARSPAARIGPTQAATTPLVAAPESRDVAGEVAPAATPAPRPPDALPVVASSETPHVPAREPAARPTAAPSRPAPLPSPKTSISSAPRAPARPPPRGRDVGY